MQSEVPHFIIKGSSVLSTLVHELSFGPVQFRLSPLFIRNLKFCTLDEDQKEMFQHLLSFFHDECTQLIAAPRDILMELCASAIKNGVWHRHRQLEVMTKIEQSCPHILMHNSSAKAATFCKDCPSLEPLSSSECKALLIQTCKLNDKINKLKSLRQSKKGLQSRLHQQINEVKPSHQPVSSNKMIENVLTGADLSELPASLAVEIERFHDILAYLEQDIKDEELFWRWIVGSEEQLSTLDTEQGHHQIKREINDVLYKFDGRVQELLKVKSITENGNIMQISAAAEDEVRTALSSLTLKRLASDEQSDTSHLVSGAEVETSPVPSLIQLLEEVSARNNLVSPRMVVLHSTSERDENSPLLFNNIEAR